MFPNQDLLRRLEVYSSLRYRFFYPFATNAYYCRGSAGRGACVREGNLETFHLWVLPGSSGRS
jgi:hypothetical protein